MESMLNSAKDADRASELRYALDVMEENSHLGLDDEAASRLRAILLRRIRQAEAGISARAGTPARFLVAQNITAER